MLESITRIVAAGEDRPQLEAMAPEEARTGKVVLPLDDVYDKWLAQNEQSL